MTIKNKKIFLNGEFSPDILQTTWHPRRLYDFKYVYAVLSRRSKGVSIGINLNPDERCNYDCVYCQINRTQSKTNYRVELAVFKSELSQLLGAFQSGHIFSAPPFSNLDANNRKVQDVAFSGDGEPTAFRQFSDCVDIVAEALKQVNFHDTKVVVITNATYFHKEWMQAGLKALDRCNSEIWAKLDAGTQTYMRQINATDFPIEKLVDNIARAGKDREIVIQSLFANIKNVPPSQAEIKAYICRLKTLINKGTRIKNVQIYTVVRPPAKSYVTPLSQTVMSTIVEQVKSETKLQVEVF